jgi:ligand-binding sensor domain-containing protein
MLKLSVPKMRNTFGRPYQLQKLEYRTKRIRSNCHRKPFQRYLAVPCVWLIAAIIAVTAFAQTFQWQSYTNTDHVNHIIWYDGQLWCATSGGLMAYHPQSQEFQVWTNSEGLSHNNAQAIGVDHWGRIWLGLSNAHINIFNPITNEVVIWEDFESAGVFEITAIDTASGGDDSRKWILVGHDEGLTIFRQGEGAGGVQIAETVHQFGNLESLITVSDIAIVHRDVWVSTFLGVARASLDNTFLSPPTVWTTYTIYEGLPMNNVVALTSWQGTVIAGTEGGVAQFNGNQFQLMGDPIEVQGLFADGDSLWAWTASGLYAWNGNDWQLVGDEHPDITGIALDHDHTIWAGHGNTYYARGSLAYLDENQWSPRFIRNGISWNKINAVYIDSQKRLWVTGSEAPGGHTISGVNLLDNSGWHNWTRQDPLYTGPYFQNQGRQIIEDPQGHIWGGSFGGGAILVTEMINDTLSYYTYGYSEVEQPWLIGYSGDIDYVLLQSLAVDALGDLWMVNRGAANGNMLVHVPSSFLQEPYPQESNSPWNYVSTYTENLDPDQDDLLIDDYGRIWVTGGDPNDSPGEIYVLEGGVEQSDWTVFAFSDPMFVNEMALDHTGTLWLATRNGVYYAMQPPPQELSSFNPLLFPGAIGGNVQCVHVDAQNNKWFGTDRGVSVLNAAFTWVHHFPADQGPVPNGLVGANVLGITSNYATGEVWIATTTGLSRVVTPYRESGGALSSVKIYPNPFHPGNGNRMQFKVVDFNRALIYSITGKRIREMNALEAMTGWDGRGEDGDMVGSGVYLILITGSGGDSKLGKVAVVR